MIINLKLISYHTDLMIEWPKYRKPNFHLEPKEENSYQPLHCNSVWQHYLMGLYVKFWKILSKSLACFIRCGFAIAAFHIVIRCLGPFTNSIMLKTIVITLKSQIWAKIYPRWKLSHYSVFFNYYPYWFCRMNYDLRASEAFTSCIRTAIMKTERNRIYNAKEALLSARGDLCCITAVVTLIRY